MWDSKPFTQQDMAEREKRLYARIAYLACLAFVLWIMTGRPWFY